MSLVIKLPPALRRKLAAEAAQQRLPLAEYAARILANSGRERTPVTGADVVAFWKKAGLIGSRRDITDPSRHARALRERAQKRVR